ncbi:MAG: triose-phosphate isomerase [Paludibacteraceae bacterium]|nr:triose-phosphate isomerase [Paludibacteraceae bacterium]
MRKNIVAGNWKMNMTLPEGVALAKELNEKLKSVKTNCDVMIAPPFTHLASIVSVVDASRIKVAAQTCSNKVSGAFTGEVSPDMVKSTGAVAVILGHSERRQFFGVTDEQVREKVDLVIERGMTPIVCIGEKLEQREAGNYFDVIATQVKEALFHLSADDFNKVILAYEPVWAIGTGKTATADQAEEVHKYVRDLIASQYGAQVADDTTILYGGSCKPSNARELFSQPDVDGGLIGGASLKADDFMAIITAF